MEGRLLKFLKKKKNLALIFVFATIIIFLPIIILRSSSQKEIDTVRPDQIKIEKGDKIVIIGEDGTVKYISAEGVYYDTWDSQTVSSFFQAMRSLAKEYINKASPKDTTQGYWVSLFIDGKLVKVFIEGTNAQIEEILTQLAEGLSSDFLSDLFEKFFSSGEEVIPTPFTFSTASPTQPLFPTSTPTPKPGAFTPSSSSVEEDCKLWLKQGLGSTIISNTVCIENK